MKKRVLKIAALLMAAVGFAPQAQADTDLLTQEKGYTKITQMPADENLDDYYFIIVDKEQDLMMTLGAGSHQGNQYKTWWYRTSVDPATDLNRVWTIEANHGQNNNPVGYAFRSVSEPSLLMQTEWNEAWLFRTHDQANPCEWTQFILAYDTEGESWTIENGKYDLASSTGDCRGFVGAWDNAIKDGAETAANKRDDLVGHFVIYSILKTTFDNFFLPDKQEEAQAYITSYYEAVSTNSSADEEVKAAYTQDIATAKFAVESATVIADIDAAMAALETARQTYVLAATPNSGFSFDYSFLVADACNSTTDWTKTYERNGGKQDNYQLQRSTNKNNGDLTSDSYIETWTDAKYNAGQLYYTATDLPAGHYKISAYTFDGGKSGAVNFFVNDADHSMQLDNSTDLFTLSSIDDVAIAPYAQTAIGLEIKEAGQTHWVGITNIKLEYLSPLAAADLELAKAQYEKILAEAEGMDITTNVGENAFQIPTQAVNALTTGIASVKAMYGAGDDIDKVVKSTENLEELMADYRNATLNAPADGQVFNIEITTPDNWKFKNLPLTLHAGGASFYPGRDASCYAQTLMLKQAEGNLYTISTVFADGKEHYLCTAQTIGTGNTNQIRTTDDASKALLIKVIPTDAQGVYNLWNTEANGLLGCQDGDDKASGGLYSTSSHPTFAITETDMPSVTLTTAAEWATLILPFNAEIPDGLEVYSCAGTETEGEDATLVLGAVEAIAANTPYIVKAAADFTHTFEGFGAAETTSYTVGMLTGTFAEMEAVEGTYVLQNQAEKGVGFYKVETEKPIVKANRAYLNAEAAPAGSNVQAFILKGIDGDGTTTGIDGTVAEADATVNVYNLNGILVRQNVKMSEALDGLQKGIYIVNGTKKAVK